MPNNPNVQTALEIVTDAFRAIRVLADEETSLDQQKATLGFRELCGMLDQWRLEGWLTDNANGIKSFNLVVGKADYSVGAGGDIDLLIPPAWISQAFLTDANGAGRTYPLGLCANEEFYRAGRSVNVNTAYSMYATYITTYPMASLKLYPIPALALQCTIVYPEHIAIPATLNETLVLSPGFRNAMVYALASVLTIAYPTDASGDVRSAAVAYMDRIKASRSIPVPSAILDPAVSTWGSGGRMKTSRQGLYDIKSNAFANTL
jgi:hypothetical protein